MEELGYQPNRLARSLRSGKTQTIGMIVPDSADPFFAEVARGIEDTAFENGYSLILCNSDANLGKEAFYTDVLVEKQVDGILFLAAGLSTERILDLQQRGMPVVVVDRELPAAHVDLVVTDNAGGGWSATRHLIDLGHRRIGYITAPSDLTLSEYRSTGYRKALEEAGIAADENLVVRGDFDFKSGYRAARQLLANDKQPTAIFASNDIMGPTGSSGFIRRGLRRHSPGLLFESATDHHRPAELRHGRKGGQSAIGAAARPRQAVAADRTRRRAANSPIDHSLVRARCK
jgi:LacI family transcriptional regulator